MECVTGHDLDPEVSQVHCGDFGDKGISIDFTVVTANQDRAVIEIVAPDLTKGLDVNPEAI